MVADYRSQHRGFEIRVVLDDKALPPFRATVRRLFTQVQPQPGVFEGASREAVISRAKAEIDRILGEQQT
jgi:hypothetical protein